MSIIFMSCCHFVVYHVIFHSFQLTEFLGDTNEQAALDVLLFIREAIQKFDVLKPVIIEKLLESFHTIKSVK